jgi:EAL domain-containing protein (putative c-di-GMP-specific phosphodiesterase class I)
LHLNSLFVTLFIFLFSLTAAVSLSQINHHPDSKSIVKAIIAMAHNLDLRVIAEGIETEQQCLLLQEYGCDVMQGFYFTRALPVEEFISIALESRDVHSGYFSLKG